LASIVLGGRTGTTSSTKGFTGRLVTSSDKGAHRYVRLVTAEVRSAMSRHPTTDTSGSCT
jgi:hypothetical protein